MRNHCLQQIRDKKYFADESVINSLTSNETSLEEAKWYNHSLDQLDEALKMLNDAQRETITLFYLKKCSYEQITEKTGLNFMQVKSYIQNGKRNLKTILLKKLRNAEK